MRSSLVRCRRSEMRSAKRRSASGASCAAPLLLILLSTSCAGLPRPPPEALDSAVCRALNVEEWTGVVNLSRLAREMEAEGDEDHIGKAVRAYGGMLKRCWPELFRSE